MTSSHDSRTVGFQPLKEAISNVLNPSDLKLYASLQDRLKLMEGMDVNADSILKYIEEADDNDIQPLITFIVAAKDADEAVLKPETQTPSESNERLQWVIEQLGLSDFAPALEQRMPEPEPAVIIQEVFTEWYTPERQQENTHYWDDYRKVLSRNRWDAESIETVGTQATEVIRRIDDPKKPHDVSSRGLVVGYVQSGKTANFTAVTAKAIDAGYRFIIILAGTMDNLRDQTQRRLDKELCGKESVLSGLDEENLTEKERKDETYFNGDEEWDRDWGENGGAFLSHGPAYGSKGFPRIKRVTTSVRDYRRTGTSAIEIERPDKSKPVHHPDNLDNMPCLVAVVKKNSSVLKNLNSDLRRAARLNGDLKHLPVLVIDDESDQASINTKKQKKEEPKEERERTAVNEQITELLSNCPRAQYVGYTATPFANVFVDPSDPVDLYPQNFVLMLSEPPAYRGAKWFHDRMDFADAPEEATRENSQSKAFIRDIVDSRGLDDDVFEHERAEELKEALDMFVLTGAIKKFREAKHPGHTFKHHTMLVHEGTGTAIHGDGKKILEKIWRERGYNLARPIPEMKRLFEDDLLDVMNIERYREGFAIPRTYEELLPYINEAYAEMMVGVQSGESPILQVDTEGKQSPNFESGRVWKVLVGGAKLSRGYTVEGLTISYFRRRAGSADTLMQTGRWFGFRKGYQDLVRLYAPVDLVELFEAAMHDEEVFRDNIKIYAEESQDPDKRLTPSRIAPLVRQSLPDLKPTSSNKMFNAYIRSTAAAPNVVELNSIPDRQEKKALKWNFQEVGIPLLQSLDSDIAKMAYFRLEGLRSGKPFAHAGYKNFHVGTIAADVFVDLLETMQWYEGSNYKGNIVAPHVRYLRGLMGDGKHASVSGSDFREVAVMLPILSQNPKTIEVPGVPFPVPLVKRSRREERHDITGTDRKNTYIMQSVASGESVLAPRFIDMAENAQFLRGKFKKIKGEEPFDLNSFDAKRRGAVLVTLFDDRNQDEVAQSERDGAYTPPRWDKGEVGLALAFNSPHEAVNGAGKVVEWGVHLRGDGDGEDVVIESMDAQN
ncbi:Z1 domain-containing protein [Corynebacterium sp. MSK105]|uniref:Z1 domain-containing protein n=1 Tax=unclassified Corynebacterium TaxID=2624378 RepID=UPI00254FA53C|nr:MULTISPECIES: Z1 domain-containing protein [unclassified Corynebacterium]MDK8482708.1 Z1 domain-containing protein [Corynebacterium sp. MSK074]MDK8690144.1 Z1 domain-containing protein [Corynebacterium sp. MSK105]